MIKRRSNVVGRFKLEKFKADQNGNIIESSKEVVADWFDNLILDQGLESLGTRSPSTNTSYIHVGSGSSSPSSGDTSLSNFIAASNSTQSDDSGAQSSSTPYYLYLEVTKRFSAGAAAGNLSEVGAAWGVSASSLFSRALIVDGAGNPTTITVLADEILDVSYELRVYPDDTDATGTITLDGEVYDYTARAANAGTTSINGWYLFGASTRTDSVRSRAYDGVIGSVLNNPAGASDTATSGTDGSYSNGSLTGSGSYTWELNDGNFPTGIRSVALLSGWTRWQIEFSRQSDGNAIPKDNTFEFSLTISHSWARGSI